MRALKFILIGLLGILVIAIAAIAFIVNSVVSGGQKDRLIALASKQLGTQVGFENYTLDYKSIIALRPAVAIKGLTIANPPGFPKRNMVEAEQISAHVDLSAAMKKKIEISSLEIESPKILIEAPSDGPTNLETLVSNLQKSDAPAAPSSNAAASSESMDLSVAKVAIRNALVSVVSPHTGPNPQPTLKSVELTLSDIAPGKACKIDLTNKLFESANSSFKLNGSIGPFNTAGQLPLDAKTEIVLALAEFPKEVMQRSLGELAAAPGPDSRVQLDLALAGDLYKTTNGKGKAGFSKFLIGGGKANRLDLSGSTPLEIRAEKLISAQEIDIQANNANLKLGSGAWNGNLEILRKAGSLHGAINGAIRSVDVNQMMTSFAGSPDKVFGTLTVPKFALNFAGDSSTAIQRSLRGQGNLAIDNGRFKGLSVLASVERALGGADSKATGEFARFQSNFAIANQVIQLNGIDVAGPGIAINGQGTVTFQEALNFSLQSKITGNAAQALRARTGGIMAGDLVVPVTVAGNLDNPQVRPEIKGLMKSAATSAIQGVLGGFLNRKKK